MYHIRWVSENHYPKHVCSVSCPYALPQYRPETLVNCHALGRIPISNKAFSLVNGKNSEAQTPKTAVNFARRAVRVLFTRKELLGHNFGGVRGLHPACPIRLMNIVSEMKKRYPHVMLGAEPSSHTDWAPRFLVTALNTMFRESRSNEIQGEQHFLTLL